MVTEYSTDKFAIGQFNLMCNYAWYFHREEYDWHIQKGEGEIIDGLEGGLPVEEWKDLVKDRSLTEPAVRTADHYKYCSGPKPQKMLNNIAYCVTCKETDDAKVLKSTQLLQIAQDLILEG